MYAGGSGVTDAIFFAREFGKAGMDFLSLSRGGKFDDAKQPNIGQAAYPYTGPSGYECMPQFISDQRGPFGRNFASTKAIRDAVYKAGTPVPIVGAGGIHNFEMAEQAIVEGVCDVVAAARQSLADPDWFLKLSLGMGEHMRVCQFTNYCEGLDQKHKQVTCKLWDRAEIGGGEEGLSTDRRRRLTAPEWNPTKPQGQSPAYFHKGQTSDLGRSVSRHLLAQSSGRSANNFLFVSGAVFRISNACASALPARKCI
jgi:dimethylglycine catabolism A